MKLPGICFVFLFVASAALAQMTPGVVVKAGDPFPIIVDFNGDGLDDVINERSVILNDGTSLSDVHDLGLPAAERVIGVLDVNGDHIPDLLTEEQPAYSPWGPPSFVYRYRVYIGDAARHYANGIQVSDTAPPPAIADVDGDGKDDLLLWKGIRPDGIRTTETEITVLRSRGDGTFDRLPSFRTPPDPQFDEPRVLAGDLNRDGIPDLVLRCPYDLVILRGLGGGKFAVESRYMPMALPTWGWWSTRLADIDGDGNLDVVMAGVRTIRVVYGDGHGNLPRTSTATIAKQHGLLGNPPHIPTLDLIDELDQPRDLAIGHFTRADRNEIAAGTPEGDLVVYAYENGALREVSRTQTEFWGLDVRAGRLHASSLTDVYGMGTLIWGDIYPRPRVFYGTAGSAATAAISRSPIRRRATAPAPSAGTTVTQLRVRTQTDCIADTSQRFTFTRDGVFGRAMTAEGTAEAVFDGNVYIRFHVPGLSIPDPVMAVLSPAANGGYAGTVNVVPPCGGSHVMTVTAGQE